MLGTHALIMLLPVLTYLVALVFLDSFKLVSIRLILIMIVTGAMLAAPSYLATTHVYAQFSSEFLTFTRYVSPWIEEVFKALPIVFLLRTRRVGLLVDAAIAGFAVGTGFALVENLYYLTSKPDAMLFIQLIRGFGTAIMHGGSTATFAMVAIALTEKHPSGGLLLLAPGYLAAVMLHSTFNQLLVQPAIATFAMAVILPAGMFVIFRYSERSLRQWIESDLDSKIAFLRMINRGQFLSSPRGKYLRTLNERFSPEHRVDMLCYLRLHAELAVRAKLVLLMRDVGMNEESLDAETRSKLTEIRNLESALGRAGLLALRPLLKATGKDFWQLTLLRH